MLTRNTMLAAAFILGSTGAALAQPGPGMGGWHHGDGLLEGVTLTDAQQQQVHALMKAEHQNTRSLREQLHAAHDQIETTMLASGTVTEAQLAPIEQQESSLMAQLGASHLATQLAIRNLLTADQIATASSTHAKMESLRAQEHALHAAGGEAGAPASE